MGWREKTVGGHLIRWTGPGRLLGRLCYFSQQHMWVTYGVPLQQGLRALSQHLLLTQQCPSSPLLPVLVSTDAFPWDLPNKLHAFISEWLDDQDPGRSCPWWCSAEGTKEARPGGLSLMVCVCVCTHVRCLYVLAICSLLSGSPNTTRGPGAISI